MLKIDRDRKKLLVLSKGADRPSSETGLSPLLRQNLTTLLLEECGEDLFILGYDVTIVNEHESSIDALAIDAQGRGVVIDLGEDLQGHNLTPAAAAAKAMSEANWETDLLPLLRADRVPACQKFLEDNRIATSSVNASQRLLILREGVPDRLLQAAEWMRHHGMYISCYSLLLIKDSASGSEYISATAVFPSVKRVPEDSQHPVFSTAKAFGIAPTVADVVARCESPHLRSFIERLSQDPGARIALDGSLSLARPGAMRFRLRPGGDHIQVSQSGRFPGDEDHWEQLSAGNVTAKDGELEFTVRTPKDVNLTEEFLLKAATIVWWLP